jgi:hypothetical protein
MKLLALTIQQPNPLGTAPDVVINGVKGMPVGGAEILYKIVGLGFDLLILAAIILSLFNLIWGGLNWIMSEGNKDRVGKARERIVYSILGLLVVFLSFFVINIIYYFFFKGNVNPFDYTP